MWSRCGCVSTTAASRRTPRPRSCCATFASGGPWSTRIAPSGTWSSAASPCPTSRNVIRSPVGGGSFALGKELPDQQRRHDRRGAGDRGWATPARQPLQGEERERRPEQDADRRAGADLSERQPAHEPRAGGDVGGDPAVQERERERRRRQQRLEQRAHEREAEQRADRQGDEHVREQRVDRHAPELEPQDRRGGRSARGRDRERVAQPVGQRVALEREPQPRHQQEDRSHGRERELEAGLEQARRGPGEQDRRAERQEVPAVARPRQRARPARPARPRPRPGRRTAASRPRARSAAIAAIATTSAASRGIPSSQASPSTPSARNVMFCPETARRW